MVLSDSILLLGGDSAVRMLFPILARGCRQRGHPDPLSQHRAKRPRSWPLSLALQTGAGGPDEGL